MLEAARRISSFTPGWRKRQVELSGSWRFIGTGVSCTSELVGHGRVGVLIRVGFDRGGCESGPYPRAFGREGDALSGSMPQGKGHATTFAQIVVDVLQLPLGRRSKCVAG